MTPGETDGGLAVTFPPAPSVGFEGGWQDLLRDLGWPFGIAAVATAIGFGVVWKGRGLPATAIELALSIGGFIVLCALCWLGVSVRDAVLLRWSALRIELRGGTLTGRRQLLGSLIRSTNTASVDQITKLEVGLLGPETEAPWPASSPRGRRPPGPEHTGADSR